MPQQISRRNLLLLLVGLDSDSAGLGGITRLQKLLFLLEEEEGLRSTEAATSSRPIRRDLIRRSFTMIWSSWKI